MAPPEDPTRTSRWRPLRLLQSEMDAEIGELYAELGLPEVKPSWVMELLRLRAEGPMTITELARSVQRTHSAMSQKVSAMRAAGLVQTGPGRDARSKAVSLTDRAREVVDELAAEWRATEAAIAALEDELPYPLSRVVDDITEALARRSFGARIREHLQRSSAAGQGPSAPARAGSDQPPR